MSQNDKILALLRSASPGWVPAPALAQVSLQYSARIFALRRGGFHIENRVEIKSGVKHGFFRLVTAPVSLRRCSLPMISADQGPAQPELFTAANHVDLG